MEIPIRAKVLCSDGPGGEATHVVIHPATRQVTRLVVKERRSPHIERLVPLRLVQNAGPRQVRLNCSQRELYHMRTYLRTKLIEASHVEYERSYAGLQSLYSLDRSSKVEIEDIREDELALDAGTKVQSTDGPVGRIDQLLVDPASGSITHLRLRRGPVWAPKEVTIPGAEVARIGDRGVDLRINRAGVEALPTTAARRR